MAESWHFPAQAGSRGTNALTDLDGDLRLGDVQAAHRWMDFAEEPAATSRRWRAGSERNESLEACRPRPAPG